MPVNPWYPMTDQTDISDRVRELLAAEYEADGYPNYAQEIRSGTICAAQDGPALRAIEKALTRPPVEAGVREALFAHALTAANAAPCQHEQFRQFFDALIPPSPPMAAGLEEYDTVQDQSPRT